MTLPVSPNTTPPPHPVPPIPYKIAVLAYIFNDAGQLLLLHRRKPPNQDLYSPVGGKLEQALGESPYACALREIQEEVGIPLTLQDIRLLGLVSERAFQGPPNPTPSMIRSSDDSMTQSPNDSMPQSPPPAPSSLITPPSSLTSHWLMFCFEVLRPLNFPARQIDEGRLEWFDLPALAQLPIPKTDREIIWPLVQSHSTLLRGTHAHTFFSVHIDCRNPDHFTITHEHR